MDENVNVFERNRRAKTATLSSDRMNRFDRHVELERKRRAFSDTQAEREQRNEEQRNSWHGDGRNNVRGTGVKLTPELLELKRASDASRTAAKTPLPSDDEMADVATAFRLSTPEFRPTLFNCVNLFNCSMHAVAAGKIRWSIKGLREVSAWLEKNGYYEGRPGDPKRSAPRIFEEYRDADQIAEERAKQAFAAALVDEMDRKKANAMSFEELRDEVRKSNPHYASRSDY